MLFRSHFEVGDAETLEFPNDYFDIIIAKHAIHYLANVQNGINEAFRCLRNGGTFLITLNSERNKPLLHKCESFICKKYGLSTSHCQKIWNIESIQQQLFRFSAVNIFLRIGKISKPRLFLKYFATFEGNYEPQPTKAIWTAILQHVISFAKNETTKKGTFVETCRVGLILATK